MNVRTWTSRDADALQFLRVFLEEWGVFPNYRAIGAGMGTTSLNATRERLGRLEAHGVIERVSPPHMGPQWRLTGKWPADSETGREPEGVM